MAPAPGGRAVPAQPDHPHRGVRPAQDAGRGAAGAGHGRAGDRRVAVDAGDRCEADPAGRGQAGGDRRSSRSCPRSTTSRWSRWRATSSVLVPPTTAHNTVENAINSIQLQDSTAIGEGIATALRALQQAPKDPANPNSVAPGAIVLLSDGSNTTGRSPQQAAAEAQDGQGADLHDRVRHRERLRRPGRQAEPVPVDHQRDEADRRSSAAASTSPRLLPEQLKTGLQEHRLRGRLREGRPRGHLPLRRLRTGLRRARRPRRHLPGSEVAVMDVWQSPHPLPANVVRNDNRCGRICVVR